MKKILVLGSGFISKPGIKYLADQNIFLTVASNDIQNVSCVIEGKVNCRAILLNIDDNEALQGLIKDNDIVVSILPWIYHIKIAKICLEFGKHFVTTSYVSDEMKNLDYEVRKKGLIFLNEMGLDPGIDHMSAMFLIEKIHSEGGRVIKFFSNCGGLPSPDNNDNPVGYKFSWSPRGVLLAAKNPVSFLENGRRIYIEAKKVFKNYDLDEVEGLGYLEVYPNRNSLRYIELYNLQEAVTFRRGTYRYPGWCSLLGALSELGFLNDNPLELNKSLGELISDNIGCTNSEHVKEKTAEYLDLPFNSEIINNLEWLGLFSDTAINKPTKLDILCELLQSKLFYKSGEKDMVILHHKIIYETKEKQTKSIKSILINYGIPESDSAMSRTVSLPMAIGVKLIAEGVIKSNGVLIPTIKDIYEPVLEHLSKQGIVFKEEIEKIA